MRISCKTATGRGRQGKPPGSKPKPKPKAPASRRPWITDSASPMWSLFLLLMLVVTVATPTPNIPYCVPHYMGGLTCK